MEQFYRKCAEHGLKITPQRRLIYEELMRAKDHPTADAIYKRVRKKLPNISFDTVYRTLHLFSEIGIAKLVEGYGEDRRFEPNLDQHHHFRCLKCHAIYDFHCDSYDELPIPKDVGKYGLVVGRRVVLEGICVKCRK